MRHGLDRAQLIDLFAWSEAQFLEKTAGSAIRRIGHERWLRNIAVALGNAPTSPQVIALTNSAGTQLVTTAAETTDGGADLYWQNIGSSTWNLVTLPPGSFGAYQTLHGPGRRTSLWPAIQDSQPEQIIMWALMWAFVWAVAYGA